MRKNKQADPITCCVIIILTIIVTTATRSGGSPGKQSYIETHYTSAAQLSENKFCLNFAKSISGTMEYKNTIYQDCKGD